MIASFYFAYLRYSATNLRCLIFGMSSFFLFLWIPYISQAATGVVTIATPVAGKSFNTQSSFIMKGSYIMTEDATPVGERKDPACVSPYNPSGWAMFSPTYWDTTFWSGTHAELWYSVDGVRRGMIGGVGFTRGIYGKSSFNVKQPFSVLISTSGMAVGTTHSVTVYLVDVYGKTCRYGFWYWPFSQGMYRGGVFASATFNFTIADPTPAVSMTLGKPSILACEAETGTITVTSNDPSPNGGTVTLTFPNGTTASAAFTGKTATLTFADFGLPNGYTGTHKPGNVLMFAADVTTAAGYTVSSTATANVVAGGLNVTITPAKTVVEPTISNKYRKWIQTGPSQGVNRTDVAVLVENGNTVVSGASVDLYVERASVKYGGHDHDAAVVSKSIRPLGTLSQTIGSTDATGSLIITYSSPSFAAQDRIVATASFNGCTGNGVSSVISSKRQGLQLLTVSAPDILYGGTDHHTGPNLKNAPYSPDHTHFLSPKTMKAFKNLLTLYKQQFRNKQNTPAGLKINDAALPLGGRFEAITQETRRNPVTGVLVGEWTGAHTTHSLGTDIDVGLTDTNGGDALYNLRDLKDGNNDVFRKVEGHPFPPKAPTHIHIYFNYGYQN